MTLEKKTLNKYMMNFYDNDDENDFDLTLLSDETEERPSLVRATQTCYLKTPKCSSFDESIKRYPVPLANQFQLVQRLQLDGCVADDDDDDDVNADYKLMFSPTKMNVVTIFLMARMMRVLVLRCVDVR